MSSAEADRKHRHRHGIVENPQEDNPHFVTGYVILIRDRSAGLTEYGVGLFDTPQLANRYLKDEFDAYEMGMAGPYPVLRPLREGD